MGWFSLVSASKCELGTNVNFEGFLCPANLGQLIRRLPKLGSVSVAASENLDVPKKYQTRFGWVGSAGSQLQNVNLAQM